MADDVLKSFLVAIGYKEDAASRKKMTDGLANVEKAVVSLSLALAAAATAATAAAVKMAASFEDLFYASQRTGASINNLRGLAYAVSQLGGSYGGAVQSLEAFAKNLRTNPGYESMARKLGVATRENGKLRDTVDILTDLGKVFKNQPYYVANQYAQALGLDERTFQLLRDQPEALKKYRDEYEKTTRRVGLDSEDAARKSIELMQSFRSLQMSVEVVAQKLLTDFAPALTAIIDKLRAWIEANPDQIREWIEGAGKAAVALAAGFMKVVDAITPLVAGLGNITSSITGEKGLQGGLEAFAIWLTTVWLVKILAAFTGVSTGWAAMLLRMGLNPATLLAGAAVLSGVATAQQLPRAVAEGRADPATGGALDENPLGAFARPPAARTGNGALEPYRRGWLGRLKDRVMGARPSIRKGYEAGVVGGGPGSTAPIKGSTFASKAPGVMRRLMEDFGLTKEEAGVVLGNLGHESAGFTAFEEGGNGPGRGWAQWTDPGRKRRFFQFAQDRGLDPKSDEANYGFLKWELENTHKSSISGLKNAQGFDEKMRVFEGRFEGAGVKAYGSRNRYAARAMAAYDADEAQAAANAKRRPAVDPDRMKQDFGDSGAKKYDFTRSPTGAGEAAPLGSGPVDNSTRSFTQTNKTEIVVQGGSDPQATANAVAGAQSRVHELSLRNAQGAVR